MTAETATTTDVMTPGDPPATVTVRRSWAIGGLVAVVVVIVAMAIALAAVAGDDGARGDFPGGPPSGGTPGISQQGMVPPEGIPDGGSMPQPPDGAQMPGLPSAPGTSGSQSSPGSGSGSGQAAQ